MTRRYFREKLFAINRRERAVFLRDHEAGIVREFRWYSP